MGERRAALFGGWSKLGPLGDDLFVVELSRHTVVSVVRKQYLWVGKIFVKFCIKYFHVMLVI